MFCGENVKPGIAPLRGANTQQFNFKNKKQLLNYKEKRFNPGSKSWGLKSPPGTKTSKKRGPISGGNCWRPLNVSLWMIIGLS